MGPWWSGPECSATARISLMSSSRSSGKGCDPSPNESDSWSLSPHAAALDSGRVHGANLPSEGFPPPSLKGRCLKAIWRYMTLSERLGSCVIGRMVGRSEISMPWCAHGSGERVPPPSSSASGLSEAETGSPRSVLPTLVGPPSASGTGACCPPACSKKVPSAASGGSLGSPGAPCPPASAPPGRVPLGKGWPLRDPASSAPGTG